MDTTFNFTHLGPLFKSASAAGASTLSFELRNGRGRFVFMFFFAKDEQESYDTLFLFLRNTHRLLRLKLYGFHKAGDFLLYLKGDLATALTEELMLNCVGPRFDLVELLSALNNAIPANIPMAQTIETLRDVWPDAGNQLADAVDDASKIYLIGMIRLPPGKKPQEKTLRKLYMHTRANPEDIAALILYLKKANMTVAWSADPNTHQKTVAELLHA